MPRQQTGLRPQSLGLRRSLIRIHGLIARHSPPLRLISRLIVDAARPRLSTIARTERSAAMPLDILSRSVKVKDRTARIRTSETIPPFAAKTPWIEPACLPKARPISLSDCPDDNRSQSSLFCPNDNPGRPICPIVSPHKQGHRIQGVALTR